MCVRVFSVVLYKRAATLIVRHKLGDLLKQKLIPFSRKMKSIILKSF